MKKNQSKTWKHGPVIFFSKNPLLLIKNDTTFTKQKPNLLKALLSCKLRRIFLLLSTGISCDSFNCLKFNNTILKMI